MGDNNWKSGGAVALIAAALVMIVTLARAQTPTPTATPTPPPPCSTPTTLINPRLSAEDRFGQASAISGNLAVVGAYQEAITTPTFFSQAGLAYVFGVETGSLVTTLRDPNPDNANFFGIAVSISGNLVAVGAQGEVVGGFGNAGAVFTFNATTGALLATINNPTPDTNEYFGSSVGISGNLVVAGATNDNSAGLDDVGIAYVFNATTGALVATLNNPNPDGAFSLGGPNQGYDRFGNSVGISGNLAVIGAANDDPGGIFNAGRAYVFNASTGALVSTLNRPAPVVQEDYFGWSVAISGDLTIVGAPYDNNGLGFERGRAYVYDAATGTLVSVINDPDEQVVAGLFAESVAISGNLAVTGSRFGSYSSLSSPGIAHVFDATSGNLLTALLNPDPAYDDQMGSSVGISGDSVVAGAWFDNPGAVDNGGSAFLFTCMDLNSTPVWITTTVESPGGVGEFSALEVVNGRPAIAFHNILNTDLKYVRANDAFGATWPASITLTGPDTVGSYLSMKIVNGRPAIVHPSNTDASYVRAADGDGTGFDAPLTFHSGVFGTGESLAIVNGRPAVAFDVPSQSQVKYVRANDADGATWGAAVILDASVAAGNSVSLAVVNGRPAVSYHDTTTGELRYVRASDANGTAWGSITIPDPSGNANGFTSLAVVNGRPAIAYDWYDSGTLNYDLKFVRANNINGTSWGTPVTPDDDEVGYYVSLAVIGGLPAITYYDFNGEKMRYVEATNADGTGWQMPEIPDDGPASTRSHTESLDQVSGGPAISYYDVTNGDLKYAYRIGSNPVPTPTPSPTPTPFPTPVINVHPASQTVKQGKNVTFTVEAAGAAPITYQWMKGGSSIELQTGMSLTLNNVTAAADQGLYRCDVTNPGGTVPSNDAQLTVLPSNQANAAQFQGHSVPATMAPQQAIWIGIRMRNSSALSWNVTQGYSLAVTGDPDNFFQGLTRIGFSPPDDVVAPNSTHQFLAHIRSPGAPGSYSAQLQMVEELVEFFGPVVTINFEVAMPPNSARDWAAYE